MQNVLLSITSVFILLFLLEAGARLFIYCTRGSSTVGMPERTLYLQYQPFVMFGPDWDKKVDDYNLQNKVASIKTCRILLLGGSTAGNFPEKILEKAFLKKFPEHNFKVLNMAAGGYNARQEVIVGAIWGANLKPDIIITLDGANDLIHRLRMKTAGTFYLNATYENFLKRPVLAPFFNLMIKSQLIQGLSRLTERKEVGAVDTYRDAIPVYISAQHSINSIAAGSHAKRIMVLQPFMAFKEPLSNAEMNFKPYKYRETIMKQLYESLNKELEILKRNDGVLYVDARFIFNGISKTIFSDDVHFVTDEGYNILAEHIVNAIDQIE